MIDGFFSMTFTGTHGTGFGVLALRKGVVVGTDVAGASYDGSYRENPVTHALDFNITMSAPAGIRPVQTGELLAAPTSIPITVSTRAEDFNDREPTLLRTELGPVNAFFRKIHDFPE